MPNRFSSADDLPLILCGPVVRRTGREEVSVWVALRDECDVALEVFENARGEPGTPRLRARRPTIRLGRHLHAALVSARAQDGGLLAWGESYLYDLIFHGAGGSRRLGEAGIERFLYPGQSLPSFVLPGATRAGTRLVHGSCRKPHGPGLDGLSTLDELLAESIATPGDLPRPQQLFLTGDQIYADDVADELLGTILERSALVLEHRETETELATFRDLLAPGRRQPLLQSRAGFSSGEASSHLVSLAEYYGMYLFAWSDALWADGVSERLRAFRGALPAARRALANISTYMIFDDHEVTDDWYLTRSWVRRATGSALGPRILRNALAAYAVFQHWGNAPAEFAEGTRGGRLLEALDGWDGTEGDASRAVRELVPVPSSGQDPEPAPPEALRFSYSLETPVYRVVALDTRTRRSFRSDDGPPGLMSLAAIDEVLGPPDPATPLILLLSPTPVLGVKLIEFIQRRLSVLFDRGENRFDVEAWPFDPPTYDALLERLSASERVLALSGDVHYGFGATLRAKDRDFRMVNFVSSALCNEVFDRTLATLLNAAAGPGLEGVAVAPPEAAAVHDVPQLETERRAGNIELVEEVLPDEAAISESVLESFPATTRLEGILGSANLGDVVFDGDRVEQTLHWRHRNRARETLHRATLPPRGRPG